MTPYEVTKKALLAATDGQIKNALEYINAGNKVLSGPKSDAEDTFVENKTGYGWLAAICNTASLQLLKRYADGGVLKSWWKTFDVFQNATDKAYGTVSLTKATPGQVSRAIRQVAKERGITSWERKRHEDDQKTFSRMRCRPLFMIM